MNLIITRRLKSLKGYPVLEIFVKIMMFTKQNNVRKEIIKYILYAQILSLEKYPIKFVFSSPLKHRENQKFI